MRISEAVAPPAITPLSLRTTLRDVAIKTLGAAGRLSAARRAIARRGDIVVLTLHRIVPDDEVTLCRSPCGMVLRESLFRQLIQYLTEYATVISPGQTSRLATIGFRPKVLLSFDDGWIDNTLIAKSILSQAGMRACFFVVTSLVGTIAPFWPEQMVSLLTRLRADTKLSQLQPLLDELRDARDTPCVPCADEVLLTWLKTIHTDQLKMFLGRASSLVKNHGTASETIPCDDPKERLMTWDQIEGLISAGHLVGSHTKTHALLPLLDHRSLLDELAGSRCLLRERLAGNKNDPLWLSYPNGSSNPKVTLAAFETGYRNAFSTSIGTWGRSADPLLIPRVNVWDGSVADSNGRFSPDHADYALFWRSGYENS